MRSIAAAALFRNNRCRLQCLLLGSNPFSTSRDDGLESCRKIDSGNIDTTESRSKSYSTCRPPDGLLARIVSAANVLNISKPAQCDVESSIYLDETSRVDDFHKFVTILVFDTETTGLSTKDDRIIEIAVQDLRGGENSTFERLVNPEQSVENTEVHNITTDMVRSAKVPTFKDVIPMLRDYVRSRQELSNSPVLLVAHNGWRFDVPLLINEFKRCAEEIPSDWLFLDTMGIPLEGKAHRAMSHSLSEVLRAMTKDLKLPLSSLLDKSFKASDLSSEHKKATKAKKK